MNMNSLEEFDTKIKYYYSFILNKPLIGPYVLQFSVTRKCPLRCKMCEYININKFKEDELNTEESIDIINQAADYGFKEVFFVGGEPFVRKDLYELIKHAYSRGMKTSLATSGALLNDVVVSKLVKSHLTSLLVSIDGANANTHDSHRKPGIFNRAIKGIEKLNREKRKIGRGRYDSPHIIMLSIVDNSNLEEILDMVHLAERLNLVGISFQPLQTNNTIMYEKTFTHPLWINKNRLPLLDKVMDEIEEYKNKTSLHFLIIDTDGIKKYFRGKITYKDMDCYMNYLRMCIAPEGWMTTCSAEFGEIGRVREKTIKDLWESPKMKRSRVFSKRCSSLCLQRCIYIKEVIGDVSSLSVIVKSFLDKIEKLEDDDRKKVLNEALEKLLKYESILKDYKSTICLFMKTPSDNYIFKESYTKEELKYIKEKIKEISFNISKLKKFA
jgi:MoaA/NifB/PqqE/SkfB family radical SAM enzyme